MLQAACRSSRLQVACHSPRLQAACRLARTAEPAARERRGIRQSVNVHFSFPFPLFISAVRVQNFPRLRRSWDCRRVMDGRRWSSVHGREGFGPEGFEVKSGNGSEQWKVEEALRRTHLGRGRGAYRRAAAARWERRRWERHRASGRRRRRGGRSTRGASRPAYRRRRADRHGGLHLPSDEKDHAHRASASTFIFIFHFHFHFSFLHRVQKTFPG